MNKLITIQNISYLRSGKTILDKVSFSINEGDKMALLGSNGSGKTTLIDIITQDIKPTSGAVTFKGSPKLPKGEIGVLYGCFPLFPYLKVREQVRYYSEIYRLNYKKIKEEFFQRLGLNKIQDSYIYQLSQGERQKLGVLISIINNPNIIIWDEPFSNLDPIIIDALWGIVNTNNKTIFYSTHNWEDVSTKSTKVCLLHEGKLLERPKSSVDILSSFPKQNTLVVETNNSLYEVINDYEHYELDGSYYVFFNTEDPLISQVSQLTNNFSVGKISLIDYYRYKISKI